jgi:SAM-dependent methyltransferase
MKSSPTNRYERLLCEFYDFIPPCASRPDRAFFVGFSRAAKGPTLELGCGTGRLLIPTAAAGCSTVGLDLSPSMLKRCRQRLRRQPRKVQKRVRLIQGNMAAFDLGERFALVTIPYRGFQHLLTVKEQLACLRRVRRHLLPGGKLILDLFQTPAALIGDPECLQESDVAPEVKMPDGRKFRMTSRVAAFHPLQQYNDFETIFYVTHPGRRRERVVQKLPLRYLFRFEAEHLLARCGFRTVNVFGDFNKTRLKKKSIHMLIVAEKMRARLGS